MERTTRLEELRRFRFDIQVRTVWTKPVIIDELPIQLVAYSTVRGGYFCNGFNYQTFVFLRNLIAVAVRNRYTGQAMPENMAILILSENDVLVYQHCMSIVSNYISGP